MKPKVSIILPVFNGEKTVERCLKSLIGQTYRNTEIIAVDDGSMDRSLEILKKFQKVRIISSKHKGKSHARNLGLKFANGQFVFFGESDAYYSNNFVSACVDTVLNNPKVGSVAGRLLVWNKEKFLPKCKEVEREYAAATRKPKAGWFYLRRLVGKGFDERLDFGEDIELADRVRKQGFTVEWCKKARWYHYEPELLSAEFDRNLLFGRNILELVAKNRKLGLIELLKSFYYPLLTLTMILTFLNPVFSIIFLLLFSVFLVRFIKFFFISTKLGYHSLHILFLPVIWIIRSYARFLGIIFSVI